MLWCNHLSYLIHFSVRWCAVSIVVAPLSSCTMCHLLPYPTTRVLLLQTNKADSLVPMTKVFFITWPYPRFKKIESLYSRIVSRSYIDPGTNTGILTWSCSIGLTIACKGRGEALNQWLFYDFLVCCVVGFISWHVNAIFTKIDFAWAWARGNH